MQFSRSVRHTGSRHGTGDVKTVGVQNRIESLLDKPSLNFLDRVTPLVARQESVEAIEHLSGKALLARHFIDTEKRQIPTDPSVALLEEELDNRIESEHDRIGDGAQQTCR